MGTLQEQLIRTLTLLSKDYPEVQPQIERASRYHYPDEDPKTLLIIMSILQRTLAENPEILNKVNQKFEFNELEKLARLHSEHIVIPDEPKYSPSKTGKR